MLLSLQGDLGSSSVVAPSLACRPGQANGRFLLETRRLV